MVATVRCEEIANEKYASFSANEVCVPLNVFIHKYLHVHAEMHIFFGSFLFIETETDLLLHMTEMVSVGRSCTVCSSFWLWEEAKFYSQQLSIRVRLL